MSCLMVAWTCVLIYAILFPKTLDGKLWTENQAFSDFTLATSLANLVGMFFCSAKTERR
jgi:hypothetical protein